MFDNDVLVIQHTLSCNKCIFIHWISTLIITEAVLIIKGDATVQLRISAVLLRKIGRWNVPYARKIALNAILFLLSGNTAGVFSVLYTSIMGLPVPFAPVHLLFINLLTDSLPALAIGMEPADERLLDEKPRDPKTGIMTRDFVMTMIAEGVLIAVVTMTAYHIGIAGSPAMASTMARLFHGFNCRSKESIFTQCVQCGEFVCNSDCADYRTELYTDSDYSIGKVMPQ